MNRSGMIKRGLASTAIAALAVTGIPALAGTAHAAVGVTVAGFNGWTAFDVDELTTGGDDIVVTVKDGATPTDIDVEYDVAFTPVVGAAIPADGVYAPGGDTGADGIVDLTFDPTAAGSYTVTVRTVGTHIAAPAFTFEVGESEITLADGETARSPISGSDTYAGKLALVGTGTPLAGREVSFTYSGTSTLSPAKTNTAADGSFSTALTDSALPAGDTGTLTATALALTEVADDDDADASDSTVVTFEAAPVVSDVVVTPKAVFGGTDIAPGKPVELTVKVLEKNLTPVTTDDDVLDDIPVSFAVDKGFLSPDAKAGNGNLTPNDLVLTADQDDKDDLFGFYEDLGADEIVDTSDDQGDDNAAGIVATIQRHADFNDDGLAQQTVTVTAGGVTKTVAIDYDARKALNIPAVAFRKDGGSTNVPGSVDLKFYAVDQFGNLVGDQAASISDNTPVARVVTESPATTDFINDNPAATASSSQPVSQVITGRVAAEKNLVAANGDRVESDSTTTGTTTLVWTKGKSAIVAKLQGASNGAKADKLTVVAPKTANGAVVKLFKVVGKKLVPAGTKTIKNGKASFSKADKNGKGATTYIAKVSATSKTKADTSNPRKVK